MAARWIAIAAALGCLAGCSRSAPLEPSPPYNTSISLHGLMENVLDPTADVVWGASGTMVDFEGEHDLSPRTDDAWARVHDSAVLLAESGNLLLLPGRLQPGKTWTGQAQKLSLLGIEAMRAADARDKAALLRIGGDIHDACEECHRVYVLGEPPKP
jgi:hypothetical protein